MLVSQNAAFHKSHFRYGSKERFSLLLLEPGETFFKDYAVNLNGSELRQKSDTLLVEWKNCRLRVCSKSVVFEPPVNDLSPLIKVLFRDLIGVPQCIISKENDGTVVRWFFISKKHTLMLENGVVKPFSSVMENCRWEFVLLFNSLNDVFHSQITKLWQASTESTRLTVSDQNHIREAIIDSALAMINFDKKWLERDENILMEENCKSIGPLTARPGLIVLTDRNLFFVPINDSSELQKFEIASIKRALRRRYALQSTGVEIYCQDRSLVSDIYLAFASQETRELFMNKLASEKKSICDKNLGELNSVTQKWMKREISNFDYIFYLNLAADRSINDIHQYPVFPWIISDYESSQLDLSNPDTYRDLTKPIGALNPNRLANLRERYEQMSDPKFLFGTHYSAPAFVLFYLVRLVPECVLCLQNGQLDQPDRTFHSILELWNNVNHCPHDFKELIPEFFDGDGEFLLNAKKLDFGVREDGARIDHVILPKWAQGSAKKFIELNRKALESDHVSKNLHHWIDLIFGYKQKGRVADQFDNLFHPLTYEGGYEQALTQSEVYGDTLSALRTQVLEFGQCPVQLFTYPHPCRDDQIGLNNFSANIISSPNGGMSSATKQMIDTRKMISLSASDISNVPNPNFTALSNPNFLHPLSSQNKTESLLTSSCNSTDSESVGKSSLLSSAWRKLSRSSVGSQHEDGTSTVPVPSKSPSRASLFGLGSPTQNNNTWPARTNVEADEDPVDVEDDACKPIQIISSLTYRLCLSLGDKRAKKGVTVKALDVNYSGELIALAMGEGRACVLSTTDSKPKLSLRVNKTGLTCCKFLNRNNKVVFAAKDGLIHVVSLRMCKVVFVLETFNYLGSISHMSISVANSLIAISFKQQPLVKLVSVVEESNNSCVLEERNELDDNLHSSVTYLSLDDFDFDSAPYAPKVIAAASRGRHSTPSDPVANTHLVLGTDDGSVYVIDALLNSVDHQLTLQFNDAIVAARVSDAETFLLAASLTQIKLINISMRPHLPVMQSDRLVTPIGCAVCANVEQIIYSHVDGTVLNKFDCMTGLMTDKRLDGNSMGLMAMSRNNRFLAILSSQDSQVRVLLWHASE